MDEETDHAWRALSEAVLAEVKQWRTTHPKATFQELEQAIHERISRLETQVLQDAALASRTSDWSHLPQSQHPRCPSCGTALRARGKHPRHLQGPGRQAITLSRSYGTCPACGVGLFPPR